MHESYGSSFACLYICLSVNHSLVPINVDQRTNETSGANPLVLKTSLFVMSNEYNLSAKLVVQSSKK